MQFSVICGNVGAWKYCETSIVPILFSNSYNFTYTVHWSDYANGQWVDVTSDFSMTGHNKYGFWLSTQNTKYQGHGLRVNIIIN